MLFLRSRLLFYIFFFFYGTATTEIYTLSLHDALPILLTSFPVRRAIMFMLVSWFGLTLPLLNAADWLDQTMKRSEERFSRNAETDLVCRLLLEKKKKLIHRILASREYTISIDTQLPPP